jgi:acetoin utilization deacetylase AcuC-like enzyme
MNRTPAVRINRTSPIRSRAGQSGVEVVKVYHTDHFSVPLPAWHTFPMAKYARLRQSVVDAALVAPEDLVVPHAATDEKPGRVHAPDYLGRVLEGTLSVEEVRALGLPWSAALIERARRSCGATIEACRSVLRDGVYAFTGRG